MDEGENGQKEGVWRCMWRYGRVVIQWGSAALAVYLALFYWTDAVVRLGRAMPTSPLSWGLVILTLLPALLVLWFPVSWSWMVSAATISGLLVDWHPFLVVVPLAAVMAAVALRWYRPGTTAVVVGRRLPIPWPVALTPVDRFLHLHVLGPTGSGKSSSVLMPLISQDAAQGHGVLVLDPKGDLAASTYRLALSSGRSVIRFDPSRGECPHFNPLSGPSDSAAEGLAWSLNQISAPGHPYYAVSARVQLLHGVRVVKAVHGEAADIGHVLHFFRDTSQQRQMVMEANDAAAHQYFQEQWSRKSGASREDRQGLLNRLELLWANPAVRRVLSAPADFTWDEVLKDRWVVAAPLSLAHLGESARALGTLLWHGMAQATYRRSPTETHPPFFAYLDEFYQWVSDDMGDFLALARGYSVGLILAHQDMGQLSDALKEAVTANARHRIILPGSAAEDIARFRRGAEPYPLDQRVRYLKRGRAVIQTTQHGRLMPPWIVRLSHQPLSGADADGY